MSTRNEAPTTLSGVDIETRRSMVVGMIGDGGVAEARSTMTAAHSGLTEAEWRIVGPSDGRRVLDMMDPASVRSASYPFRLAWVEKDTPHLLVAYTPQVTEHRVGQLWQRRIGGAFEIVALERERAEVRNVRGNRKHWIRRDRLKPKAYRLLREAVE